MGAGELMQFEDALKLVRGGMRVTRTLWGDQKKYIRLGDNTAHLRYINESGERESNRRTSMPFYPTQDDMINAKDWEIVRVSVGP